MPSIFTPIPAETEHKSPGIGGKPPVDRRPTGGGGGGGDDDWRNAHRGPRELLHRVRAFVFCGLAGDMMFFVVLVVLFYARQTSTHLDPGTLRQIGDWHPVLLPPILFLNTAALLLSSLTMEMARRHIFREIDVLEEWLGLGRPALNRTLPWIAGTLVLGALFLAGQLVAWKQLTVQGFTFDRWSTPASYFFYVITGLHAAHLVLGVLALVFCLCGLTLLKRVDYRQVAVDATAWFWHTMGLAWVLLFAVLLFGQ
ncbi:MAG TPA: cytochrome c oxidase subunit 3 [Terracidiphilus sp.]|jgi:cytochrome c oxidase subunit III|nr:cytochrome c oxidase subunit 3 [Terracidiphilus sp.]